MFGAQVRDIDHELAHQLHCALASVQELARMSHPPMDELEKRAITAQVLLSFCRIHGVKLSKTRAEPMSAAVDEVTLHVHALRETSDQQAVALSAPEYETLTIPPDRGEAMRYIIECTLNTIERLAAHSNKNASAIERQCAIASRGIRAAKRLNVPLTGTKAEFLGSASERELIDWAFHFRSAGYVSEAPQTPSDYRNQGGGNLS